jgi:predicted type IV restriction endonuclease
MAAPDAIRELIERFQNNIDDYRSPNYKEFRLRKEFVDPFFDALGWDVSNKGGYAEAYKDVVHEDSIKISGASKAPDYAFRIGGTRKFFVETKAPAIDIKNDTAAAYQLRRYGWSAKLPLSILTDFEEFAIYDCRVKPDQNDRSSKARILYINFEEYDSRWDEIKAIFGREAILKGAFDRYASDATRKRGTAEVDSAFLAEIEEWRASLAKNLALRNKSLNVRELNTAVQRTIDRIIFLRIAEDRGFEPYGSLQKLSKGAGVYGRLAESFRNADARYNSGLFHFRPGDGSPDTLDNFTLGLSIDDKVLRDIFSGLYYPDSPYEFSVLPADILGQVYEQFLGKVIRLSGRSAIVEDKPEVAEAGGVYYTPTYIVRHMIEKTLGELLKGKTYAQASGEDKRTKAATPIRILDPACGSGSFLIEAYQYLLDWYRDRYIEDGVGKHSKNKQARLYEVSRGEWHLTIAEKRRILLTHIFGVDIDTQAVEVTKLSLLMKVLEGEKGDALAAQMSLFHMRALPDLDQNIRCGNSLVSMDFYDQESLSLSSEDEIKLNPFNWPEFRKQITGDRGFDVLIGNPPYVVLQDENRQSHIEPYIAEKYKVAAYKVDTYHLFIEKALSELSDNGRFSFITPSNFLTNNHTVAVRDLLTRDGFLAQIINFRGRVFTRASVDTCIFFIDRTTRHDTIAFITAVPKPSSFEPISEIAIPLKDVLANPKRLISASSQTDSEVIKAIETGTTQLGKLASVNFGKQLRDRAKFPEDVIEASGTRVPRGYARCYTGKNIQKI